MTTRKTLSLIPLAFAAMLAAPSAFAQHHAHGMEHHDHAQQADDDFAFGREGQPEQVTRTIAIDMDDAMRFSPSRITVQQGETVRFIVTNKGKAQHEMVLGTMDELKTHNTLMQKHGGMEHEEAYMVHVAPGDRQEMIWQFTKAGEFHYGCLLPGHFEAGMIGKIIVTKG